MCSELFSKSFVLCLFLKIRHTSKKKTGGFSQHPISTNIMKKSGIMKLYFIEYKVE